MDHQARKRFAVPLYGAHECSFPAQARIFDYMKKEYVRAGYLYSGAVHPDTLSRRCNVSVEHLWEAAEELAKAGLIRRRNCNAVCWELTPQERLKLINEHDLATKWELDDGSGNPWPSGRNVFYPMHAEFGEITRVRRECCVSAMRASEIGRENR